MSRLQRKSFAAPDEVRAFPSGHVDVVHLDDVAVGRFLLQPGWRWSKDVQPVVRTSSCQNRHIGYAISGSIKVTMDDGTELVIGAGDAYEIPPGHEVLVVGDEPWDSIEFTAAHTFGLGPGELRGRRLATVLFSDVVGSTAALERLGDHEWTTVLDEHNVRIRTAIDRFGGREVVSTGDGFLALFDGASKAVHAGALMDPAVSELGIRVRVGIHTSEVEMVGGQPRGVGVHAAARVAALAGPGEVFVSGTTRDLLDGSGLSLDYRGEYELKGLTGPRPIFALRRGEAAAP
jgi:class 3 adenylate cyclase